VNGRPAKDYLSRGQQKLLMLSLLLAQASLMNEHNPNQSLILIDDLSAELDLENKAKLLKYLDELGCQVFITATGLEDFGDLSLISQYQVFHVKQGSLENQ
jgi:DNA replication and repair protein RecF